MKGLGINEVNDQDTANSVLDWLTENYGSIFEGDFSEDVPSLADSGYEYEPVEMDLTYTPRYSNAEKTIIKAFEGNKFPINEPYPLALLMESMVPTASPDSLYEA